MSTYRTLQDLLIDELRDILGAERMAEKALGRLATAATDPGLKEAFVKHRAETEQQIARVGKALEALGKAARGKECKAMVGLVEEGEEMMEAEGDAHVRDAGLIGAAQRVEHYEIAAYGCAIAHAQQLGLTEVVALLEESVVEEEQADRTLSKLATAINAAAAQAGAEESDA